VNLSLRLLLLLSLISAGLVYGQTIDFIQYGENKGDSSYYDIFQTSDTEFWIGGKGGILKKYTLDGSIEDIPYPKNGNSILRINKMGDKMILAADKGILYVWENQEWKVQEFQHLRKSCFYDLQVIDSLNAFLCGGKSKIAVGKRTIPYGFIMATKNGGETWTEVFKDWKRMVWRLKWVEESQKLFALTYSPLGSRIFEGKDRGASWSKTGFKNNKLIHDFEINTENSVVLAGGISGNLKNSNTCLLKSYSPKKSNSSKSKYSDSIPEVGLLWDYSESNFYEAAGACSGNIIYKSKSELDSWKYLQLAEPINLYEILFFTDNQAIIIGSNKSILQLKLPDSEQNDSISNSKPGSW
jgi:hypothetical protein